jgi:hypothetical protein
MAPFTEDMMNPIKVMQENKKCQRNKRRKRKKSKKEKE